MADIAAAAEGYLSPVSGKPMIARRAIEVGNIFKLGTFYSESMGVTYLDENGKARPVVMGSYGIGSGRNAATVVEQNHDEQGHPLADLDRAVPCLAALAGQGRRCHRRYRHAL